MSAVDFILSQNVHKVSFERPDGMDRLYIDYA